MLASEALGLDVIGVKLAYPLVIELDPLVVTFLDVAEIVPEIGSAVVDDHALQLVGKLLIFLWHSLFVGGGELVHIQVIGELPS